jgi:tetratricopeptide (TPR) repeat protein
VYPCKSALEKGALTDAQRRVAQFNLALGYVDEGDSQRAIAALNDYIARYQDYGAAYYWRGKLYFRQKESARALEDLELALQHGYGDYKGSEISVMQGEIYVGP